MAGTGAADLEALAEEFLAACAAALDTVPNFAPGFGGAPERSFISPGKPAIDCCDQLTVHVDSLGESDTQPFGLATGRRATMGRVNLVTMIATITRCVPIGTTSKSGFTPPAGAALTAAASQLNADAWALWNHIYNMVRANLFSDRCSEVFWAGMRSLEPSGACGGWTLTLRMSLDGYEEIFGT